MFRIFLFVCCFFRILKRQGHQAIRGGTLESAVHIYNQTFSEEVQGRYSDLEEVKKIVSFSIFAKELKRNLKYLNTH